MMSSWNTLLFTSRVSFPANYTPLVSDFHTRLPNATMNYNNLLDKNIPQRKLEQVFWSSIALQFWSWIESVIRYWEIKTAISKFRIFQVDIFFAFAVVGNIFDFKIEQICSKLPPIIIKVQYQSGSPFKSKVVWLLLTLTCAFKWGVNMYANMKITFQHFNKDNINNNIIN